MNWQNQNDTDEEDIRLANAADADGDKVLMIEEVQSDITQQGDKEGYQDERPTDAEVIKHFDLYPKLADAAVLDMYRAQMVEDENYSPCNWVRGRVMGKPTEDSITVYVEVPVLVTLRCYPEYKGARDKYGQKLEPDEDAGCEIDGIEPESDNTWAEIIEAAIEAEHADGGLKDEQGISA